jgi:protein-disulfide isomerase
VKQGIIGAVIALLAVAILYMATHKPTHTPEQITETASQLKSHDKTETAPPAKPETATAAPATPSTALATTPPPAASSVPPAPQGLPGQAATTIAPKPGEFDLATAMSERSMGDPGAPVTVIEYASLTCPHCAHFATTILPEVKRKLIDTGKMRLIYRDFPLDALAMKAAQLSRCAPKDKYFNLIEVIFQNRERWLANPSPETALRQFGALAGMEEAYMKTCMESAELESAIANGLQEAQGKFYIKATPTFVFDYGTETISGAQELSKFEEIVNRLTAAKKPQ